MQEKQENIQMDKLDKKCEYLNTFGCEGNEGVSVEMEFVSDW